MAEEHSKTAETTSGARARDGYLRLDAKRVHLARSILGEVADGRKVWGGCDDFALPSHWTAEERAALSADMHGWNGDPEDDDGRAWRSYGMLFGYLTAALTARAEVMFP